MAKTDVERDGRRTAWRNPVLRFQGSCQAPAEVVYDLLADLQSHLEWAGQRQGETTRLLTLAAPPGPADVGVEFVSTGSDGKLARWSDRSVVTEATRPEVFEFVTDGRRQGKPGRHPWLCTAVHRYVIAPEASGCQVTYTEDLTRLDGAPLIMRTPGVSRIVFRMSAKYMRRGFDGLLALAEERGGRSRSTDGSGKPIVEVRRGRRAVLRSACPAGGGTSRRVRPPASIALDRDSGRAAGPSWSVHRFDGDRRLTQEGPSVPEAPGGDGSSWSNGDQHGPAGLREPTG